MECNIVEKNESPSLGSAKKSTCDNTLDNQNLPTQEETVPDDTSSPQMSTEESKSDSDYEPIEIINEKASPAAEIKPRRKHTR